MGLDHGLYKKYSVKNYSFMKPEEQTKLMVAASKGGKQLSIKPERIAYIVEDVAQWRKENWLHGWFVDNVQGGDDDCKNYYVDAEALRELLELINTVMADHKQAPELLPTREGFFFGSTDYDEYYWQGLEEAKQLLTDLLAEPDADGVHYEYWSSW